MENCGYAVAPAVELERRTDRPLDRTGAAGASSRSGPVSDSGLGLWIAATFVLTSASRMSRVAAESNTAGSTMLELAVLLFALLVGLLMGGVLGGMFAELRLGFDSNSELLFITTGAVGGVILALGIAGVVILPLP